MRINRVTVTRFRNHGEKTVEWSDGINLLLGENGAGKSSILEAVGMALFNVEGRSNLTRAIAFGCDSASIRVELTANDGNDYVIEKRLGKRASHILYPKDNPAERIALRSTSRKESEPFWQRVKQLIGLGARSDIASTYQYVITAYQNGIVDGFLLTDQKKQDLFNAVFNTEIYRKLSTTFLKQIADSYGKEEIALKSRIDAKSRDIRAPEEIRSEMEKAEKDLALAELDGRKSEEKVAGLARREKELQALRASLEKQRSDLVAKGETKAQLDKAVAGAEKELAEARHSQSIVEEHCREYKEYLRLKDVMARLSNEIGNMEKIEARKNSLEKDILRVRSGIEKAGADIAHCSRRLEEEKGRLDQDRRDHDALKLKIDAALASMREIEARADSIARIEKELAKVQKDLSDLDQRAQNLQAAAASVKSQLVSCREDMESEASALEKEKSLLEKDKAAYYNLKADRSSEEGSLMFLLASRQDLATGICPFLREECRNIKEYSTPDAYFEERESACRARMAEIESRMTSLRDADSRLDKITGEIAAIRQRQRKDDELRQDLAMKEKELHLVREKIDLERSRADIAAAKAAQFLSSSGGCEDPSKCLEDLHEESLRAGKALAAQEGAIESDRKVLADLAKKIARHEEETGRISKERDTAEYEAGRLRETLAGHEKSLEELAGQILDLPGARENRDRTKAEMDRLQVAYDEYMKHTRTAGKTALCEEALAKARDARDRMKALIEEGERRYHEDKSRYSPEEHAGVERDLESATAERNARLLEVGSAKARSDQLRAIFQENETLIKEVEEWRREESLLARKIVLTGSFRDRVNELGKYVSETLMRRVAALASDNFRRLTGRNERIVWENTESESYAVYMAGSKGVVTYFKDLSGGEQVVVALSLRAAITSLLTDVRFAVFDEPTINLDAQRREALAFYLKDLLKGLEQSIIVTHDGTFEEMAKTVVRL